MLEQLNVAAASLDAPVHRARRRHRADHVGEERVLLSDRVLVMRDRAIAGELQGSEITEAAVVGLAAGPGSVPDHGRESAAHPFEQ